MYHLDRIPNPYAHLDKDRDLSRLSADISYADKAYLHKLFPERGLFNRLTQVYFNSIVEEAKELNLKHYTPDNVNTLIELIRRRCTPFELTRKEYDGYDPRRTPGIRNGPTGCVVKCEHLESAASQRQSA